ncbi:MAG: DoxX family protein [Flavobacteriia bacterium]|nr:MAG: DoxX family protein [Flavobacteriia bacterium]
MIYLKQHPAEILILFYLIITFTYSFMEKVFDWKNTVNYYREHFKDTFLKNAIPLLLVIVIIMEMISVYFCVTGIYSLTFENKNRPALYGLFFVAFTLIGLMLGQRIAKDYAGAMNITVYFILSIIGILLLQ